MKILIMGTGGVGGYYGGLLAQQGNEVTFIARGAHLYAIRHEGLKVKSIHGAFTVFPANATEEPAKVEPVDLILFCVKTYNTDEAAEAIRPAMGPQTAILSLQNGVDAAERIGQVLGAGGRRVVIGDDEVQPGLSGGTGRPAVGERVGFVAEDIE